MRYVEYGNQNPETVILLHGGGLSWWNYREVAQHLADKYHVVLPILDGHADSDAPFTSIEDNAARIIAHIDEHFGGKDGQSAEAGTLILQNRKPGGRPDGCPP